MATGQSESRRKLVTCPICSSANHSDWLEAAGFQLVHCNSCGHKYSLEVLSSECLSQTYYSESADNLKSRLRSDKELRFAEYVEMLEKAGSRKGRVLDVGCNAGELLGMFAESGWQVAGVEISPGPAKMAQSRLNATIWQGAVETVLPDTERFDLVTFTHVLEHLLCPQVVLERLRLALGDGVLLVEVPNADDRLIGIWGGHYRPLCPGDHVSFFSETSLRALLDRAGFDVIEVRSPTHAKDLIYPSLLSTIDGSRRLARSIYSKGHATSTVPAQGVLEQTRYRGRLRVPFRRGLDFLCSVLDPLVVATMPEGLATGPVLIATARSKLGTPLANT